MNETARYFEKDKLSEVICFSGLKIKARLVIDASGHKSNFVKRPVQMKLFYKLPMELLENSSPPVNKEQFVLMIFVQII